MEHPLWPLFDLRLATPDLALRHLTEADLPELTRVLPLDVELNPADFRFHGMEAGQQRGVALSQSYWRSLGTWTPDSWAVRFGVFHQGELVGAQVLEGDDFLVLRTVDSASFLTTAARSRGWGKQMRRAVLALAFGPLGAEYAITSAWHDNAASLGVSRSLGYVDNGIERHRREGQVAPDQPVDDMLHLRLSRADWERRGGADGITIEAFDACRPLFGL